jgi:hypothetical protein
MANQSPDRRTVLEMMAKAAIASQFPGFSRWVFAAQNRHSTAGTAQSRAAVYQPLFFSPHEYETIAIVTEMIIPKDESPGAHEAGVSEFIDFMAAHGETEIQQPMRDGLLWLDTKAKEAGGKTFGQLVPEQRTAILGEVAYRPKDNAGEHQGQVFFRLIRRYTVMGYYTSRIGLEELDYPGLKLYAQSPACPHTDDPEHLHLPTPRF